MVSLDLRWERWKGMGVGVVRKDEAARTGAGREPSGRGVVLRACPPSPYHLLWLPAPRGFQVAPALCSCSRRRGFERADSEYTDKLQHYTSGHSTYTPVGPAPLGPLLGRSPETSWPPSTPSHLAAARLNVQLFPEPAKLTVPFWPLHLPSPLPSLPSHHPPSLPHVTLPLPRPQHIQTALSSLP